MASARFWVPGEVPLAVAAYLRAVLVRSIEADDHDAIWPLLSMLYGLDDAPTPGFAELHAAIAEDPSTAFRRYTDWARRQAPTSDTAEPSLVSPDAVRVIDWLRRRVRRFDEYAPIYADDVETLLVLAQAADLAEAAARVRAARPKELLLPVLLLGESGTGKELLAKALHQIHARAYAVARGMKAPTEAELDELFGPINCGGLPTNLIEAELFGHKKGAFTGAASERDGIIKRCKDGTVFLDEIGDTPIEVQLRLLRFLNDGEVRAVGEDKPSHYFPWVIAATHRDVTQSVTDGKFREDVFNRLNGHVVRLKPLRERGDDALGAIVACVSRHAGRELVVKVTLPAERALRVHRWSGNLRAVDQMARRIVQERGGSGTHLLLDLGDLPPEIQKTYFETQPYASILVTQYAEDSRSLGEEERHAAREALMRHFSEAVVALVPEVRFCRSVAKLAHTDLVLKLLDDPEDQEHLVRAVDALATRTARQHVSAFRTALFAIDGIAPPADDPELEVVAPLPSWVRKALTLIEGMAGNPTASAPLQKFEAWLEKMPGPVRDVVMEILAHLAEAARSEDGDDDDVIVVQETTVDWRELKKDKAAFEELLQKAGSIAALARVVRRDPKTVSKAADNLGVARTGTRKGSGSSPGTASPDESDAGDGGS